MFDRKKVADKAQIIMWGFSNSETKLNDRTYDLMLQHLEEELLDKKLNYAEYIVLAHLVDLLFEKVDLGELLNGTIH